MLSTILMMMVGMATVLGTECEAAEMLPRLERHEIQVLLSVVLVAERVGVSVDTVARATRACGVASGRRGGAEAARDRSSTKSATSPTATTQPRALSRRQRAPHQEALDGVLRAVCAAEIVAPCSVPASEADHFPSSRTPALSHFGISRTTLLSAMRCSTNFIIHP